MIGGVSRAHIRSLAAFRTIPDRVRAVSVLPKRGRQSLGGSGDVPSPDVHVVPESADRSDHRHKASLHMQNADLASIGRRGSQCKWPCGWRDAVRRGGRGRTAVDGWLPRWGWKPSTQHLGARRCRLAGRPCHLLSVRTHSPGFAATVLVRGSTGHEDRLLLGGLP